MFMTENISMEIVFDLCCIVSEIVRNVWIISKILYLQATQRNSSSGIFKTFKDSKL